MKKKAVTNIKKILSYLLSPLRQMLLYLLLACFALIVAPLILLFIAHLSLQHLKINISANDISIHPSKLKVSINNLEIRECNSQTILHANMVNISANPLGWWKKNSELLSIDIQSGALKIQSMENLKEKFTHSRKKRKKHNHLLFSLFNSIKLNFARCVIETQHGKITVQAQGLWNKNSAHTKIEDINEHNISIFYSKQGPCMHISGHFTTDVLSLLNINIQQKKHFQINGNAYHNNSTATTGQLKIKENNTRKQPLGAACTFNLSCKNLTVKFITNIPRVGTCTGNCIIDPTQSSIPFELSNLNALDIPSWIDRRVGPRDFTVSGSIYTNGKVSGSYKLLHTKNHPNARHKQLLNGTFNKEKAVLNLKIKSQKRTLTTKLQLDKTPKILEFSSLKNGLKEAELKTNSKDLNALTGYLNCSFLRDVMPYRLRRQIVGNNGCIEVKICQESLPTQLHGHIKIKNAMLMPRGGCNPINSVETSFFVDKEHRTLDCDNINVKYQYGTLSIPHLTYQWNKSGNLNWLYVPINLEKCLLHYKTDLYAIASGALIFKKQATNPASLHGTLIINHSSYQGAGLYDDLLPDFMEVHHALKTGQAIKINVTLISQNPALITAPFFETSLDVNFKINAVFCKEKLRNIHINGSVNARDGAISILENNFNILRGKVSFLPHCTDDPFIDVVAKGRIKKFDVTIHVSGSAQNPHVTCTSYPELNEEQIVSLLLSGAENISLTQMLPGLMVNHWGKIIPITDSKSIRLNKLMQAITKPLKQLHLLPYFSNPESGDLGATLDIEVSPKLHASLRKGLKSYDDLSVQMEYFLTDNLSVKVAREAHGEIGGELEMRVKF